MGVCPTLDPGLRALKCHNQNLKQTLQAELKDLRIYNFYSSLNKTISNLPTRYLLNEGIIEDIEKLHFYSHRKGVASLESRVSDFGEHLLDEQIRNSCLIFQNEISSEIQSKQFEAQRNQVVQDENDNQDNQESNYDNSNPKFQGNKLIELGIVESIDRNSLIPEQLNPQRVISGANELDIRPIDKQIRLFTGLETFPEMGAVFQLTLVRWFSQAHLQSLLSVIIHIGEIVILKPCGLGFYLRTVHGESLHIST